MFEDSFVSRRTRGAERRRRGLLAASFVVQSAVAAGLLVLPLVHPASLVASAPAMRLMPVLRPRRVPPVVVTHAAVARASVAVSAPAAASSVERPRISRPAGPVVEPEVALLAPGAMAADGAAADVLGLVGAGVGSGRAVVASVPGGAAGAGRQARVSSGVAAGLLLSPIRPEYPRVAVQAQVQGVVVIEAVISRTGAVEQAHVVSGPPMLRSAALAAVSAARYRPYTLNGEAIEVQTTVSVHFSLGSES